MPTSLILSLVAIIAALVVFIVESVLFIAMNRAYYRLGPTLHREKWQTGVTAETAQEVLSRHYTHKKIVLRSENGLILFRRRWWEFGAWPRGTLSVSRGDHGAILVYEVKPFISMFLVALGVLVMLTTGRGQWMWVGYALTIALLYWLSWKWELKKFGRLPAVLAELRPLGILICHHCGYDLHGRNNSDPCPECGITPIVKAT